ncbi:unnamed protein product, partial [Brassica rapa subsp. narinosa]
PHHTTAITTPVENAEMMVTSSRDKSIPIEAITTISDVNLVEEILSRIPLKSKRAVRLTCKQWDALFKSPRFSKMHADKLRAVREGESMIVAVMDYNLYLTRVVLVDNEDPIIEWEDSLVLKGTVCAIAAPVNNADMIFTSSQGKSVQIETVTKISDLPENLVEEILSKVPLKSMRAVRLTCKHWEALSKSRSFSKMHIDKIRSGESLMIAKMGMGCNLYLVRIVLGGVNEDPFIESIESPYSHRPAGWNWFTYALGYEDKGSTCRGYKLLRFRDKFFDTPMHQYSCYEIYDFDSSTWKRLDITPNSSRRLPYWGGVSLKGNTYWLASQRNTGQDLLDDHIICFDFTSESFGPLLPLPFYAGVNADVTIACVREDKLALSLSRINEAGELEFEIWISTKIEAEKVSWTKFLTVETEMELHPLFNSGSFFIDEEKEVAMSYSKTFNIVGEDGYLKKLKFRERLGINRNCSVMLSSYVPSLVHIKQPAVGDKRKQHKDFEAQGYDKKKG